MKISAMHAMAGKLSQSISARAFSNFLFIAKRPYQEPFSVELFLYENHVNRNYVRLKGLGKFIKNEWERIID